MKELKVMETINIQIVKLVSKKGVLKFMRAFPNKFFNVMIPGIKLVMPSRLPFPSCERSKLYINFLPLCNFMVQ